jgi:hypothetical protein
MELAEVVCFGAVMVLVSGLRICGSIAILDDYVPCVSLFGRGLGGTQY